MAVQDNTNLHRAHVSATRSDATFIGTHPERGEPKPKMVGLSFLLPSQPPLPSKVKSALGLPRIWA
jgi:hypothetical protein